MLMNQLNITCSVEVPKFLGDVVVTLRLENCLVKCAEFAKTENRVEIKSCDRVRGKDITGNDGCFITPVLKTIKHSCLHLIHPFIHFFHKKKIDTIAICFLTLQFKYFILDVLGCLSKL